MIVKINQRSFWEPFGYQELKICFKSSQELKQTVQRSKNA
jgi:hypothetical protein